LPCLEAQPLQLKALQLIDRFVRSVAQARDIARAE